MAEPSKFDPPPPPPPPPTPQQTADAVAAHMWSRDCASRGLGMRLIAVSEGVAFVEMTVRADVLNGFDICHGGFITNLGDSAFAFACNSRNEVTGASGLTIDLIAPVHEGDVLTARAFEVSQAGRAGGL